MDDLVVDKWMVLVIYDAYNFDDEVFDNEDDAKRRYDECCKDTMAAIYLSKVLEERPCLYEY